MKKQCVRSFCGRYKNQPESVSVLKKQLSMDKKKEFENYKAEDEDPDLLKRRKQSGQISKAYGLKKII